VDKIFTEISNPAWWFSVVIAGIAINVFSSYLKGALDSFFSKTFSWWRNRSEAHKKMWEEQVKTIMYSPEEREFIISNEIRIRNRSGYFLILSILFYILYAILYLGYIKADWTPPVYFMNTIIWFSSIPSLCSIILFLQAEETADKLNEARRRLTGKYIEE
jgi:hypothetical protein